MGRRFVSSRSTKRSCLLLSLCLGLGQLLPHSLAEAGQAYDIWLQQDAPGLLSPAQSSNKAPAAEKQLNLAINGVNRERKADEIILYTPEFGEKTRTNPYGVEVIATPVDGKTQQYKVTAIRSIWEALRQVAKEKPSDEDLAPYSGNSPIPKEGLVLSAVGEPRQALLSTLQVGQNFTLKQHWQELSEARFDVINPTLKTNPRGLTYPGLRAAHQLLVYTPGYGKPSTETNEYGFEVTVVDGRVVDAEGADSTIPPNGYVLSGHGPMRDWLTKNAPIGAKIELDTTKKTVTSIVDASTYAFQLNLLNEQLKQLDPTNPHITAVNLLLSETSAAIERGAPDPLLPALQRDITTTQKLVWRNLPTFNQQAIKGVWHRPVELSRDAIGQTLDKFQLAGLNAVFLETFFHGYPIYPSRTYQHYGIPKNQYPKFAYTDYLKVWLEEAHQRDMQVHAWFQVFYVGNKALGGPGPILERYPTWANIQRSALGQTEPQPSTLESGHYFLDPANAEVRQFMLSLLKELMHYDVDGIQLDYIRYPASFPKDRFSYVATTWGYTGSARERFFERAGIDPAALSPDETPEQWDAWNTFKEEQVNSFVSQVHTLAEQMNRGKQRPFKLSAAVFPGEKGKLTKHQDWSVWAKAGWVDFLAPMTLTGSVKLVKEHVTTMQAKTPSDFAVATGIFSPFSQLPAKRMMEQLQSTLQAGSEGYVLFDSKHLSQEHLEALQWWQGEESAPKAASKGSSASSRATTL